LGESGKRVLQKKKKVETKSVHMYLKPVAKIKRGAPKDGNGGARGETLGRKLRCRKGKRGGIRKVREDYKRSIQKKKAHRWKATKCWN